MFREKAVFKTLTEFTGKHPCRSFSFNKAEGLKSPALLKKDFGTGVHLQTLQIFKNFFFVYIFIHLFYSFRYLNSIKRSHKTNLHRASIKHDIVT